MELSLQSRAHFVDLIFKKRKNCSFWWIYVKPNSRYSLVHILSTSSSKSGPTPSVFYDFYAKSSSYYSLVHVWSSSSSKRGPTPSVFFLCEIKLSLKSRAHFVDHFPDRAARPRKQTTSSGDHGQPLYPKKTQGFASESVFSREFTRSRSLTPQLLDDDVIDIMMWLTWWLRW